MSSTYESSFSARAATEIGFVPSTPCGAARRGVRNTTDMGTNDSIAHRRSAFINQNARTSLARVGATIGDAFVIEMPFEQVNARRDMRMRIEWMAWMDAHEKWFGSIGGLDKAKAKSSGSTRRVRSAALALSSRQPFRNDSTLYSRVRGLHDIRNQKGRDFSPVDTPVVACSPLNAQQCTVLEYSMLTYV